ncbi:hypothetical protein L211DRAFT_848452 [Terfezia boudieri ATCC MYA-4762]|uniref:N-acetyltransferase domain-containing protein n=1 Tax=Terfezia boudieri ATCC MYA-4762 TaxID=1051890 RepID=A0A3N4LWR5_9PEZI|nr:hypothetical protein L211DRAFT_848452 [Terfezia boudieri ATCC MYA-4762]
MPIDDTSSSSHLDSEKPLSSSSSPKAKPPLNITIREAELFDLPRITIVSLRAYDNDDLHHLINPPSLVGDNQSTLRYEALIWHHQQFLSPDRTTLVALAPSDLSNPDSIPKIVGFARWHRLCAPGERHRRPNQRTYPRPWIFKYVKPCLNHIANTIWSFICSQPNITNWAGLYAYSDAVRKAEEELYRVPGLWQRWELENVCVDPDYQRFGIGGKLVDWGCARADEEGLACTLEASQAGMRVYLKKGFVTIREVTVVDEEGHGGKAELTFMMREPMGRK